METRKRRTVQINIIDGRGVVSGTVLGGFARGVASQCVGMALFIFFFRQAMEEVLVIPCSSNDGKAAAVARQAGAKCFNAKDYRVRDEKSPHFDN